MEICFAWMITTKYCNCTYWALSRVFLEMVIFIYAFSSVTSQIYSLFDLFSDTYDLGKVLSVIFLSFSLPFGPPRSLLRLHTFPPAISQMCTLKQCRQRWSVSVRGRWLSLCPLNDVPLSSKHPWRHIPHQVTMVVCLCVCVLVCLI